MSNHQLRTIPAQGEIRAAKNIAHYLSLTYEVLNIDASALGSGQMAGKPTIKEAGIPELWSFRNQFLVTLAAMKFVGDRNIKIVIGCAKGDLSHKDGTKEFIGGMQEILRLQEGDVDLFVPAIDLDSLELMC